MHFAFCNNPSRFGPVALSDHDSARLPPQVFSEYSTMTVSHAILLASAGAIGTLLRALTNEAFLRLAGPAFPWGTLFINVTGSFCFGLVVALVRHRSPLPAGIETVILVGLLGGFTTFSTFAGQSVELFTGGRPVIAIAYVLLTNLAALGAVWVGLAAAGR